MRDMKPILLRVHNELSGEFNIQFDLGNSNWKGFSTLVTCVSHSISNSGRLHEQIEYP